jgi:hypothetical protein
MLRLIKSSLSSMERLGVVGLDVKPLNAVEKKLKRDAEVGVVEAVLGLIDGSVADVWLGVRSLEGVASDEISIDRAALLSHPGCAPRLRLSPVRLILLTDSLGDFVGSVVAASELGNGKGREGRSV